MKNFNEYCIELPELAGIITKEREKELIAERKDPRPWVPGIECYAWQEDFVGLNADLFESGDVEKYPGEGLVDHDIFEKGEFNESVYDFSDFILHDGIGINKFDVFTEILNFKLNSYIKEKAIFNPNFITSNNKIFSIRDSILDLISQERVYKLNKKQTILSIISNLNKITKLQKH